MNKTVCMKNLCVFLYSLVFAGCLQSMLDYLGLPTGRCFMKMTCINYAHGALHHIA